MNFVTDVFLSISLFWGSVAIVVATVSFLVFSCSATFALDFSMSSLACASWRLRSSSTDKFSSVVLGLYFVFDDILDCEVTEWIVKEDTELIV